MQKTTVQKLTEAQETLLIPLWARAQEAAHPAPILLDRKAVELVDAIDYDFDKFARGKVDIAGFCVRAVIVDRLLQPLLDDCPTLTLVEIGPGLDTRFDRLDNGQARWFEVDLPGAMEVRQRFFAESDRRTQLAISALDPGWIEQVEQTNPDTVVIVAEGVFHFFSKQELIDLFGMLADRLPGCRVVFDCQSPFYRFYASLRHTVPEAKLSLAIGNIKEVESWDPRFKVEQSVGFGDSPHYDAHFDRMPRLHRLVRRLYPPSRHLFKISLVKLG